MTRIIYYDYFLIKININKVLDGKEEKLSVETT